MVKIYVGKQTIRKKDYLVLKYPAGIDKKLLCRFYQLGENQEETIRHTGRRLSISDLEKVEFEDFSDIPNRIFHFEFDAIKLLKQGYEEGLRKPNNN